MPDSFENHFFDIFQFDFLEDMLTRFTNATGVKTLLVDYQGKPILWPRLPGRDSQLCPFCKATRKIKHFGQECERNDALSGIIASQTEKPLIYRCYMGNVEVTVPIKVSGQYLGTIKLGQIRVNPDEYEQIDYLYPPTVNLANYPELLEALKTDDRVLIPLERLKALADLLHFLANYVAQIAFNQSNNERIEQLNKQVLQEKNKSIEQEKVIRQAKTALTQKSVSVSLLLHTLDILNNLLILEENQLALRVISILSEMLRQGVYNADYTTTLGNEYDFMQQHLQLYNRASDGRISIVASADPTCLDAVIPTFSLQPLVENTIHSCLIPNGYSGSITIDINMVKDKVQILCANDGLCLPPDILSDLRDTMNTRQFAGEKTTPLLNSFAILNQYFGNAFSWEVVSSPKSGTMVSILIPYQQYMKTNETKA